jgi:DNA-directed RNA polymerase subunit RPC12/RpoP
VATTYVNSEKIAATKQLDCTSCGNALSLLNPRAKYIACQYCGSVLDANSDEHQILMSMSSPDQNAPFSFIKVGLIADFFDKKFQVIARTRWKQDYYEFWQEDGESGYSRELWIYDEWLLISEQRTYFYLVEDSSGYFISDEVIPDSPSLPGEGNTWNFMENHKPQVIKEYGAANVVYFEGESNYEIKIDDFINFASYKHKNAIYTAEWRLDNETEEIKEIEFFKETPISKKNVIKAFDANEELTVLQGQGQFWKWLTYGSVAMFALFFVMMIGSCGDGTNKIFEEQFLLNTIDDENGVISKSFKLEKGLHSLQIRGAIATTNTEAFMLAYFMNEDKDVINYIEGDFSVYSGFDDEGYWVESQDENSKLVKVKEAGTYYAKIMADREETTQGQVTLTITNGVSLTRYYVIGWIIFLILGVVFYNKMKQYI